MNQATPWNSQTQELVSVPSSVVKTREFTYTGTNLFSFTDLTYVPGTGSLRVWLNGKRILPSKVNEVSNSSFSFDVSITLTSGDEVIADIVTDELVIDQQVNKLLAVKTEVEILASSIEHATEWTYATGLDPSLEHYCMVGVIADEFITPISNDSLTFGNDGVLHIAKNFTLAADAKFHIACIQLVSGKAEDIVTQSAVVSALGYTPENPANKNALNGYAGLDAQGKIYLANMPGITISSVSVVASEAAMLALTGDYAKIGAFAKRIDVSKTFILANLPASNILNWVDVTSSVPVGVTSINGLTGAVTLVNITGNAATATKLATTRTISISGAHVGSGNFDGSANLDIALSNKVYTMSAAGTIPTSALNGYVLVSATSGNIVFPDGAAGDTLTIQALASGATLVRSASYDLGAVALRSLRVGDKLTFALVNSAWTPLVASLGAITFANGYYSITSTDVNTIQENGVYRLVAAVNAPTTTGRLIHCAQRMLGDLTYAARIGMGPGIQWWIDDNSAVYIRWINVTNNAFGAWTAVSAVGASSLLKYLAVNTETGGTAITLIGIPSWANRIQVCFKGLQISAAVDLIVQLGYSGGIVTSNYQSVKAGFAIGPAYGISNTTAGLLLGDVGTSSVACSGTTTLIRASAGTWISSGTWNRSDNLLCGHASGNIYNANLSSLDRIVITTVAGTATFTANGGITVIYE